MSKRRETVYGVVFIGVRDKDKGIVRSELVSSANGHYLQRTQ